MVYMRILVTGASGLLGAKVAELAHDIGHDVYSAYLNHIPKGIKPLHLDIADRLEVFKKIEEIKPKSIIHCAALTDVDRCEVNQSLAKKINVDGSRFLAEASLKTKSYLVYVSTDYVFEGSKGMYKEDDDTVPVNFYGFSKLQGEKVVNKTTRNLLICRPSVIFGALTESWEKNFTDWVIQSLNKKSEINVVEDQIVSPTLNTNLAGMLIEACEKRITGIYHMAGASRISRYDFSVMLAEVMHLDKNFIKRAKMKDMAWLAKRPIDSSLNVNKAHSNFQTKPMNLNEALYVLKEEIELASGIKN